MPREKLLIAVALPQELEHAAMIHDIPVIYTGVGKLNAALSLMDAIERHRPDRLINYGTAGALAGRADGLVEVAEVIQRDMDTEPLFPRGTTPFDDTPPVLSSNADGLRCATGDNFLQASDPWLLEQGVDLVDMELFALAAVCHRRQLPWRAFKFITDDSNDNSGRDWATRVHLGQALFLARLDELLAGR
ncbi:5'-methylthioadenosine nucleosidase [Castellaniella sp.]|uniref:phosphorylase family protein n=1 Tax=Castellaniella sp. TaxID=1955812 RepID=UPI00355F43BE